MTAPAPDPAPDAASSGVMPDPGNDPHPYAPPTMEDPTDAAPRGDTDRHVDGTVPYP